jgi:hypothetical protein
MALPMIVFASGLVPERLAGEFVLGMTVVNDGVRY